LVADVQPALDAFAKVASPDREDTKTKRKTDLGGLAGLISDFFNSIDPEPTKPGLKSRIAAVSRRCYRCPGRPTGEPSDAMTVIGGACLREEAPCSIKTARVHYAAQQRLRPKSVTAPLKPL
jgi:hypothetical protein